MKTLDYYVYNSLDKNSFLYYLETCTPVCKEDYLNYLYLFENRLFLYLAYFIQCSLCNIKTNDFDEILYDRFEKEIKSIIEKLKTLNNL